MTTNVDDSKASEWLKYLITLTIEINFKKSDTFILNSRLFQENMIKH